MQNEPSDPATQPRKWRRGDVGPDGRIFWKTHRARGKRREVWVSDEEFVRLVAREAELRAEGWKRKTPEQRAAKALKDKHRYHTQPGVKEKVLKTQRARLLDPEAKARHRAAVKRWEEAQPRETRRKKYRETAKRFRAIPLNRIMLRLRGRIRSCVLRALIPGKHPRGADASAAAFLLWAASRIDGFRFSEWEIDHIRPCAKCADWEPSKINAPENVRWLPMRLNREKQDFAPTEQEVAEHLALVAEWRKETRSQISE